MVLFGVEFGDHKFIDEFAFNIEQNSVKSVSNLLFTVRTHVVEENILIIHKEFIAFKTVVWINLILLISSVIPLFIWGVVIPFIVCNLLFFFFIFFESTGFNFVMFYFGLRKMGYKGKLRLV
jgi:hypothetical protein